MRKQRVWKTNHKEKLLGKLLDGYRNEEQKPTPKDSIFLWFFEHFKTNKEWSFKPRTLLKLVTKTLKKMKIFALEIVV